MRGHQQEVEVEILAYALYFVIYLKTEANKKCPDFDKEQTISKKIQESGGNNIRQNYIFSNLPENREKRHNHVKN